MTFAASLRQTDWDWFLMQKLYHARHHRLDGDVLNFVGISGGIGVIPWQGYPKMIDKR